MEVVAAGYEWGEELCSVHLLTRFDTRAIEASRICEARLKHERTNPESVSERGVQKKELPGVGAQDSSAMGFLTSASEAIPVRRAKSGLN